MKKLKFLIAILICVIMTAPALIASAHDLTAYVEWGTPVIDGVKDAVWDTAQMFEVKNIESGGDMDDNLKSSAKARTLWDGEYLYVYAEVYDSFVEAEEGHSPVYAEDTFFMALDYKYFREAGVYYYDGLEDNDRYAGCMSIIPFGDNSGNFIDDPTIFGLPEYKSKIKTYCKMTDYGYIAEARLPLFYKDKVYAPGDKLGFEIYLCNSIGGFSMAGLTSWGPGGSDAWQYTGSLGTLILKEEQITLVEEAAAGAAEVTAEAAAETTAGAPAAPVTNPQTGGADAAFMILALASALPLVIAMKKKRTF